MEAAVVRQFLNFFQDFIDLCQCKEWPSKLTTESDIHNAFVKSQHIEKSLDSFQKNGTLNHFLENLNDAQNMKNINSIKMCLSQPSKFLLKKIINSDCEVCLLDFAFREFIQLYSEQTLERHLTDLLVEASSTEILLKYLPIEISKEKVLQFKCELLLSQVTNDSLDTIQAMLKNYDKESVELIVVSLCNTRPEFQSAVNIMSQCLLDVLISKNNHYKNFWKLLFNVKDPYLIKMCVENSDLYTHMCEALIDCGKLIKENISAEYFYIDLKHSELLTITKYLFKNEFLKSQFFDILKNHEDDSVFWKDMHKNCV